MSDDLRYMAPEQLVERLALEEQVAYWKGEWAACDADYGRLEECHDALLEACRAALPIVADAVAVLIQRTEPGDPTHYLDEVVRVMDLLRAAIAKATGETP